jgi:alpha-D-ribose 1-methylphosphonate 5-triphosphate synthase subunit PhnG
MPHEYDTVLLALGVTLQDWMRITAREPLPQSLVDLLDRLEEREQVRLIKTWETGLRFGRARRVQRRLLPRMV